MKSDEVTVAGLAVLTGMTVSSLRALAEDIHQGRQFEVQTKRRKYGSPRTFIVANTSYDRVAKELCRVLTKTTRYTPPSGVTGFVHGRGTRENASQHLNQACVLKLDIKRFFDTIAPKMINLALQKDRYIIEVAELVTTLVTPQGYLATGLSPSPHLSNLVFDPTDQDLLKAADSRQIHYTRYADDLFFSGEIDDCCANDFRSILVAHGWTVNCSKTVFMRRGHQQYVTGLSVSDAERPHAPRRYKRRMRWRLHIIEEFGLQRYLEEFGGKARGHTAKKLWGIAQYIAQMESDSFRQEWLPRWKKALAIGTHKTTEPLTEEFEEFIRQEMESDSVPF